MITGIIRDLKMEDVGAYEGYTIYKVPTDHKYFLTVPGMFVEFDSITTIGIILKDGKEVGMLYFPELLTYHIEESEGYSFIVKFDVRKLKKGITPNDLESYFRNL